MSVGRCTTRPRGFVQSWNPRSATRRLLAAVEDVLDEYAAHLPLTIRQIFYRLVGVGESDKTESAYARLGEHLAMARRARILPFGVIRDDETDLPSSLVGWSDGRDLHHLLAATVERFALDPQTGQDRRLLLWCEAAGMRPQLKHVAAPCGVQVIAGGGFDSLTAKYQMAELLASVGVGFEVLHIGDLDQSGEHIFTALLEDVEAFAVELGADVTFTRLAVTPDQIVAYGLATAPPKPSDRRSFSGDRTVQAEALPPDVLADIVTTALHDRLDLDLVRAAERASETIRRDTETRLRVAGLWRP